MRGIITSATISSQMFHALSNRFRLLLLQLGATSTVRGRQSAISHPEDIDITNTLTLQALRSQGYGCVPSLHGRHCGLA
jgi:hypothetical protein